MAITGAFANDTGRTVLPRWTVHDPFVEVRAISDRHVLKSAADGSGAVGSRLMPDAGDSVLSPDELFAATFIIGFETPDEFECLVNAKGRILLATAED
jgi:hypothetical protein